MEPLILLFLFPLVGYFCSFFGFVKYEDYRVLTNLVFYLFLPCSIFLSFTHFQITSDILDLLFYTLSGLAIFSFLVFVIFKFLNFSSDLLPTAILCCVFGNLVFLGVPLSEIFLGSGPIIPILIAFHNLFIFGILFPLILLCQERTISISNFSKIFKNPIILFIIIGFFVSFFNLDLSIFIPYLSPFSLLTTPLSLIAMGIYFSKNIQIKLSKELLLIVFAKIILLPLITVLIFFDSDYSKFTTFMSLMPVAISVFSVAQVLSQKYEKIVVDSIFLSTVLSVILILISGTFGFF